MVHTAVVAWPLTPTPADGWTRFVAVLRRRSPDEKLLRALRRGDVRAFSQLVEIFHGSLVRVAMLYVRDRAVAEEVAQETWLGVLEGLDRFEGRSSLKTWIFGILTNQAKTRGERERRQVPISALAGEDEPEVAPARFLAPDHPHRPLAWADPPRAWPEDHLLGRETIEQLRAAIALLPPAQQVVLGLRDVDGWSSAEVCDALEITPGNERVLLHRARSRVRRELENYLDPR
jgi:RNA polymerase sigma-70 factor (ECF subfamily)